MKFFLFLLCALSSLFGVSHRHQVILINGDSFTGRVENIAADSIHFQPEGGGLSTVYPLEDVLYAHNGEGKLFYISGRLRGFIRKAAAHGGKIVTTTGQTLVYSRLEDELFMYRPRVLYITPDSEEKQYIELWSIHRIVIDRTLSTYAVRNGFYAGCGLAVLTFLLKFSSVKQFLDINTLSSNVLEVYPNAVTIIPLSTFGWVVYDFFKSDRVLTVTPPRSG